MDKLLAELIATGLTEQEIVRLLAEFEGVKTTQSSISRLKNGVYKTTNFALGTAIVALHSQICAKKGRRKK